MGENHTKTQKYSPTKYFNDEQTKIHSSNFIIFSLFWANRVALYTIVAEIIFDMTPSYISLMGDSIAGTLIYSYYAGDLITTDCLLRRHRAPLFIGETFV